VHPPVDELVVAEVEPSPAPGLEALGLLLEQIALDK